MTPHDIQSGTYQTSLLSEAGGRERNEDCCLWSGEGESRCWIVADGLGGHRGGGIASKAAATAFLNSFGEHPQCSDQSLKLHFAAAQAALHEQQKREPELSTMRTTLVALIADSNTAIWGHIGDSRLYRFRKCRLLACTEDHSVPQALVKAGDLPSEAIRGHRDRNRLLHSLGEPGISLPTLPESAVEWGPEDSFLLCTDGFWEHVLEEEMAADLESSGTSEEWLKRLETRLLARVSGAYDNYSAIAVFLGPHSRDGSIGER